MYAKANFPNGNDDNLCPFEDCNEEDTQKHLMECKNLGNEKELVSNLEQYDDLFSNDMKNRTK